MSVSRENFDNRNPHLSRCCPMDSKEFIKECKTVEEANGVDQTKYRFERYSDSRDCYIFIRRRGS